MAARRIVAYLPNLNAAIRHFTAFQPAEAILASSVAPAVPNCG